MKQRDPLTGRHVRTRQPWSPLRWGDGYMAQGRVRVYRPDYPGGFPDGYALRSHVVWWLTHGHKHPAGFDIHHCNRDKTDDRPANLEAMPHGRHSRLQQRHKEPDVIQKCVACEMDFSVPVWRIRSRRRGGGGMPRFCSQACYHAAPRSIEHSQAIGVGLREAYRNGRR